MLRPYRAVASYVLILRALPWAGMKNLSGYLPPAERLQKGSENSKEELSVKLFRRKLAG